MQGRAWRQAVASPRSNNSPSRGAKPAHASGNSSSGTALDLPPFMMNGNDTRTNADVALWPRLWLLTCKVMPVNGQGTMSYSAASAILSVGISPEIQGYDGSK